MYLVENIMRRDVALIDASARVSDALDLMKQRNISSLVVNPDSPNDAYGIITKRDLVSKVVAKDLDTRKLRVRDIMSKPVITIAPKTTLRECSTLMTKAGIRRFPVFEGDKLVGLISDTDIFQCVEESGWGPELQETPALGDEAFLSALRARLRAELNPLKDADIIANAVMLGLEEVYRALANKEE